LLVPGLPSGPPGFSDRLLGGDKVKVQIQRYEEISFEVEVDCSDFSPELKPWEENDIIRERAYTVIQNEFDTGVLSQADIVSLPTYSAIYNDIATVTVTFRRELA
jgi:hypothetical protein